MEIPAYEAEISRFRAIFEGCHPPDPDPTPLFDSSELDESN